MKALIFLPFIFLTANVTAESIYRIPDSLDKEDRGEYLPKAHYQILGLSVDTSSLSDIQKIIGTATVYKGQHTANHICYKNKTEVIEFSVSGFGVGYKISHNQRERTNCSFLNSNFINGYGLKIGLTKTEVLSLLGKPSETDKNSISYSYWIQEKPSKEVEDNLRSTNNLSDDRILWADICSFIYIEIENGFVSQFNISTTETY